MQHFASSGRVMIRRFASAESAVVGVLEFPPEFTPKEDVLYAASFRGGYLVASDLVLDDRVPETSGMGIDTALRSHIWRKTSEDDTLTVRFIEAFPKTNRWTVYGVANRSLGSSLVSDPIGQIWLDINEGRVRQIQPLVSEYGLTMGQMLTMNAVWPDSAGVLHALPAIESRWRKAYFEYSQLQARYGAREITLDEFVDAVKADPDLSYVRAYSIDEDFCRYLALKREAGVLSPMRPRPSAQVADEDATNARLIRELMELGETHHTSRMGARA